MNCSRMHFLFACSESAAQPPFCSCSLVQLGVGDGKGCLGVSQDTPSAWGRGGCQPDYPFPASLRSLWLRFKQNTVLKQKEREGTSAQMKAPGPNGITETFNSGEPIAPEGSLILYLFSVPKTHTCAQTQTAFLSDLTQTHFFPSWSSRLSYLLQEQLLLQASMIIKHLSLSVIAEKSPPDVMIQLMCPVVPPCLLSVLFPFLREGGVRGRLPTFLGNSTEPRCMCFKVLCGFSSFLDIALVAELLPMLTCWSSESQTLPLRKGTGWVREDSSLHFLPPSITHGQAHPSSLLSYLLWVNISHFLLSALFPMYWKRMCDALDRSSKYSL